MTVFGWRGKYNVGHYLIYIKLWILKTPFNFSLNYWLFPFGFYFLGPWYLFEMPNEKGCNEKLIHDSSWPAWQFFVHSSKDSENHHQNWMSMGTQLSNLWWMPNSVRIDFGPAMKMGSSRRLKRYPKTYMWVSSRLPFTVD